MSKRTEKPFISLGSPHGIPLSSLDKYIDQVKQEKRSSIVMPNFPADDQLDSISKLQHEQSRLCEELNAERRRSESLKSTYSRALSLSTSQLNNKLESVRRVLQSSPKKTSATAKALKYIDQLFANDPNSPDKPDVSGIEQQIKEAELSSEKEARINKALKKKIQQTNDQKKELNDQIEAANKQLEEILASKKEMKDKLKAFIEKFKQREASWKERYQALEAELEAQH